MSLGASFNPSGSTRSSQVEVNEYESALFARRTTEIPSNMKARFEWSGTNCIYAGFAPKGLAEGANGWLVQKFTYDGSNNCTERNIAYGNWTARSGYTYE
jgi:hypothetical protein